MRNNGTILMVLCLLLAGCSHKEDDGTRLFPVQTKIIEDMPEAPPNPALYMAYQRTIDLYVDEGRIAEIFESALKSCREATADQCVVLDSSLNSGRATYARLRVRAKPEGIQKLIRGVSGLGRVVAQTVTAEDLAAPIGDATRRIAMLTDYRTRLEGLRAPASSNIDALIKVNKELADVQSQLEALQGEKAQLTRRVETETLTIDIHALDGQAFWRPVGESLSGFGKTLAEGLASVITGVALLLPWAGLLAAIVWGFRKWRRRRRHG